MPGSARRLVRAGVQRVGVILAVLWGVASMAFIAVRLTPGDPVAVLTGGENVVDAGERAVLIQQYGLDRPLVVQYARYLAHALSGDLGDSYQYRQTVAAVIAEAAEPTLRLAGVAGGFGPPSALPSSSCSARRSIGSASCC